MRLVIHQNGVRALVAVCVALALPLSAAPAASAGDAPSAIDQYLEVVPGPGGDLSPEQFSRSLGGDGGPITREQIVMLARANADRIASRASRTRDPADSEPFAAREEREAPGTLAAFTGSATDGALSGGFLVVLTAVVAMTVALGLLVRRRRAV